MPNFSNQTPDAPFFAYNPFDGAQINFFPTDRGTPRTFILQPRHPFESDRDPNNVTDYDAETGEPKLGRLKQATACDDRVIVSCDIARNIIVTVNGKKTERYSIVYPKTRTRRKKSFAAY